MVPGQPRAKSETLSPKTTRIKKDGVLGSRGRAQSPVFKPQYHQIKEREEHKRTASTLNLMALQISQVQKYSTCLRVQSRQLQVWLTQGKSHVA
jgi:hypothetical protein